MPNTDSFDSIVEQVLHRSIPLQMPAVPDVNLFTTQVRLQTPILGGKVNVPLVSAVQSVQTNPTTFENSTDTVVNSDLALTHLSAQFGLSAPQANQGLELEMLLQSHLTNLQTSIVTLINSAIDTTNFGSASVIVAAADMDEGDIETLLAAVPARRILCLAPEYFVRVKNTWLPSGEENILRELSISAGLGENVAGFAARPESLALVVGYPAPGPASEVKTRMIDLPCGVSVQFSRWLARSSRQMRGSLDICLGVSVGQAGALKLISAPEPPEE